MKVEVYSFFAGVGLLDLGFETEGFKISYVNEINKQYLSAYQYSRKKIFGSNKVKYGCYDIVNYLDDKFWNKEMPKVDKDSLLGFIGGPPCPDFSIAGKNAGEEGARGQLTEIYISLIRKRKPDFFLFENVKGLYRTKKHREYYERLKRKLRSSGYSLVDSVENAIEYGAPQWRERLFLFGIKTNCLGYINKFKFGKRKKYSINQIKSMEWPITNRFCENQYVPYSNNIIRSISVEYWFKKNDVYNHYNSNHYFKPKALDKFKRIDEGAIKGKSFKRLHRWRYAPTSAYGNNEVHLHPYKARRLSIAEALAIQSAPKNFEIKKECSLSDMFKMVGNAVPFLLSKGIAYDIKTFLESRKNIYLGGKRNE
ncbi:DNA cytosine methyltransferase [uncultured Veillonella sp.]|uniref:DNA cytosine methyltransferase n=1 Tax=uncultured Veillonella sp. TaxID=159268 RepID=UPI0025880E24|nr:DNA cytosine methyltransferase [uncultured Veillonella sp.]